MEEWQFLKPPEISISPRREEMTCPRISDSLEFLVLNKATGSLLYRSFKINVRCERKCFLFPNPSQASFPSQTVPQIILPIIVSTDLHTPTGPPFCFFPNFLAAWLYCTLPSAPLPGMQTHYVHWLLSGRFYQKELKNLKMSCCLNSSSKNHLDL